MKKEMGMYNVHSAIPNPAKAYTNAKAGNKVKYHKALTTIEKRNALIEKLIASGGEADRFYNWKFVGTVDQYDDFLDLFIEWEEFTTVSGRGLSV